MKFIEKYIYSLFSLNCILHSLDIFLTNKGINRFGFWIEGNEIIKNLFINDKVYLWVLWKFSVFFIFYLLLNFYFKISEKKFNKKSCEIIYKIGLVSILLILINSLINILIVCLNWIDVLYF